MIKYYFLYAIAYSIAIFSKTIILGFMQPVRICKICDLSSFVFDHNSTKYLIVWHNIFYISHLTNALSVLEITACFQLSPKPHHTYLPLIYCKFAELKESYFAMFNICFKQVSIRHKASSNG